MSLIAQLLTAHQCVDAKHHVRWDKVTEDPILIQHVLLHIIQCCNDARFVPQEVVALEKELGPIALALCAQLVVPLKSAPTPGTATLFLANQQDLVRKVSTQALHVGFLPEIERAHE